MHDVPWFWQDADGQVRLLPGNRPSVTTPSVSSQFREANSAELARFREWVIGVDVAKFAVSGSREWIDWRCVWNALTYVPATATLLHGRAYGLDCLAQAFWRAQESPYREFPATREMWADLGRRAGHVRNEIMLSHLPDLLLAFIRDNSAGTTGALAAARRMDIPAFVFRA